MMDPDISTADALALLSTPADRYLDRSDRFALSRRRFLQGVGAGLGGVMAGGITVPGMLGFDDHRAEAAPVGPNEGILVLIGLFGGNDGLRMVAPISSPDYDRIRQSIKLTAATGLPISGDYALAPELTGLKARWDAGKVAIVQGTGYPNPDLSHFTSMAYWMSGRPNGVPSNGWIGRWLDGQATNDVFRAATIGSSIPLHMQGSARRGIGVPPWGIEFGGDDGDENEVAYEAFTRFANQPTDAGPWMKALGSNMANVISVAQGCKPVFANALPDDDAARKMVVAARLINQNLGFRVLDMGWGDFDHHSEEDVRHPEQMAQLDAAISAFYAALAPQWHNRVTIMTFSEFGRTPFDNESKGTDHGTCHPVLVIGDGVRGGLYGEHPDLSSMQNDWDRMEHTVDFRSVYASVLDGWMGGGSSTVLGGTFEDLRLFRRGPGGVAPVMPQLRVKSDFVPPPATRIWASANGTGSPSMHRSLAAGEIASIAVAGRGGVPAMDSAGAPTSVVLNVVGYGASVPTDFTVWASDDPRPAIVSGSVHDADVEPTVVVTRIGPDGKVNLRNRAGQAHYIVSVAGYFRGTAASRLSPLPAARIVDTANGVGGNGKVSTLDVKVLGQGGVPKSGVTTVLLNVSTTKATAEGKLFVWPTGTTRPTDGCAAIAKGAPTRRLVLAKVGSGGKVSILCSPSANLIVDVLGWMGTASGAQHVAIEPVAVLDTRTGIGRAAGSLQTAAVSFAVKGVGDVPTSSISGVLLEVTTSGATVPGDLSVWTSGKRKPKLVHVTSRTDRAVTNLVFVKPGSNGKVTIQNSAGRVHVRADVVGWFA